MKKIIFILSLILLSNSHPILAGSFIDDHPQLKPFVFKESDTNVRFGAGIIPFQIVKDRLGVSFSLLQVHFTRWFLDWEIFNASFGLTFGSEAASRLQNFVVRSTPKFRFNQLFSLGPVFGYEFVRFSDVQAKITKNTYQTNNYSFTGQGFIWGAELSETFQLKDRFVMKASQIFYKQSYSTTTTDEGWTYEFADTRLNANKKSIAPGYVFLLQFSLIY